MTFIYLNDDQELIHHCEACSKSEPFQNKNSCIHSMSVTKYDNSESINYNKYITQDITLPTIIGNPNIQCPNVECESIKEVKNSLPILESIHKSNDDKYVNSYQFVLLY